MLLRCKIDGLLLGAEPDLVRSCLVARDGIESFEMERVEAVFYELIAATLGELLWLEQAGYRLLRRAPEFFAGDCSVLE